MKEDNPVQTQAGRLTRMSSIVHTRANRIFRARFPDGDWMFDFAAKRIKQAEWTEIRSLLTDVAKIQPS